MSKNKFSLSSDETSVFYEKNACHEFDVVYDLPGHELDGKPFEFETYTVNGEKSWVEFDPLHPFPSAPAELHEFARKLQVLCDEYLPSAHAVRMRLHASVRLEPVQPWIKP